MPAKPKINLDNIAVAAPCRVDWADMTGTDKIRLCSMCNMNVYNISAMTRREAEETISSQEDSRFCLKIFRRSDGTILTKDCSVGRKILDRAKGRFRLIAAGLMSFLNLTSALAQDKGLEIDRYGMGTKLDNTMAALRAAQDPRPKSRILAGRIGSTDSQQADTSALILYNRALVYEQQGLTSEALRSYGEAIEILRFDRINYDPKFSKLVATKYARLLRKSKNRKQAKLIENEFCHTKPKPTNDKAGVNTQK